MQPSISVAGPVGETSLDLLNQVMELTVRLLEKGKPKVEAGREKLEELRQSKA